MAWSGWVATDDWRVEVTASVSYPSNTQATITAKLRVESRYASWSNTNAYINIGGTRVYTTSTLDVNAGQTTGYVSGSRTISRTSSTQSVQIYGKAWMPGSGIGPYETGADVSFNISVSAIPITTPGAPTNVIAKRTEDTDIDVTWTLTPPSQGSIANNYLDVQTNDGSWTNISNSLAASATSYNYTEGQPNSKYVFRVASHNSAGTSAYTSSNEIYTTPAAPQQGYAYQKGDLINASIITANINYPDTYEWQISPDGTDDSWTTLDLDIGATVIEDYQTEYDEPWFRVRCYSPLVAIAGETLPAVVSDWCTPFQASKRYEIYVNVPEGATPQAIYVNVPDGTDSFDVLFRI